MIFGSFSTLNLEQVSKLRPNGQTNNVLILRLLAASLVVYGHAFALAAPCSSCFDFVTRYFGYRYSGDVGLDILFVISGFLVTASYDSRNNLFGFVESRALRLLPALWVCLILTVAVGAYFSNLSLNDFLTSPETWGYLKWNGSLIGPRYNLPGVTLTASAQYGAIMNGSIWSLPVEMRLYFMVAIIGTAGLLLRRLYFNLFLLGMILIGMFARPYFPFLGTWEANINLAAFFGAGAFLYVNRLHVPVHWGLLGLLFLASYLGGVFGAGDFQIFFGAFIAYGTLIFGYSKKIPLPKWIDDYSYGIYIYGWPIEQLLRHYSPGISPYAMAIEALILSWIAGAISWHVVEKRALRFKTSRRPQAVAESA